MRMVPKRVELNPSGRYVLCWLAVLVLVACGEGQGETALGERRGASEGCLPGERLDCECADGTRHFRMCTDGVFPICPCPALTCGPACAPTACTTVSCTSTGSRCTRTPLTGPPCDDGDLCTVSDHCVAGKCVGVSRDCDDRDACTLDWCEADVCTHTPREVCGPTCGVDVMCPGDEDARCEDGQCRRCVTRVEGARSVAGCVLALRVKCPRMPVGERLVARFWGTLDPRGNNGIAELQWRDGHGRVPGSSCLVNSGTCPATGPCGAPHGCAYRLGQSQRAVELTLERVNTGKAPVDLEAFVEVKTVGGVCVDPRVVDATFEVVALPVGPAEETP